jgi:hypothetical protein
MMTRYRALALHPHWRRSRRRVSAVGLHEHDSERGLGMQAACLERKCEG